MSMPNDTVNRKNDAKISGSPHTKSEDFCIILDKVEEIWKSNSLDSFNGCMSEYDVNTNTAADEKSQFERLTKLADQYNLIQTIEGPTREENGKKITTETYISIVKILIGNIIPKIRKKLLERMKKIKKDYRKAINFAKAFDKVLEQEIRGGTTSVVALIHGGVLYVGNMGDSRALLCKKDRYGVLRVRQLTADHTTNSEDELQRLASLGLDISKMRGAKMGSHLLTRCIGNYFVKGGYKEFDILSNATGEPVIAEPHITSVPIDDSCSFLLLMSDGLYKSYQEATNSDQINKEIAQMVVEQFVEQPTLTSVAQTVVDKVVRLHHDVYLTRQSNITTRDDITLIIRNFNFQLRGAVLPSVPQHSPRARTRAKNRARDVSPSSSSSDDLTLRDDLSALPQHLAPEGRYPNHNPRHLQRHQNFSIDEN
ncbi:unnamed protein product, partial [Meganyctiphanes norvegica]